MNGRNKDCSTKIPTPTTTECLCCVAILFFFLAALSTAHQTEGRKIKLPSFRFKKFCAKNNWILDCLLLVTELM